MDMMDILFRLNVLTGLLLDMEQSFESGEESRYKSMGQWQATMDEVLSLARMLNA